jgi:hypothetical protein
VAGFVLGGPILGFLLGLGVAVVIIVVAARQRPGGPIEAATVKDRRRRVLVVVTAKMNLLDRWATDVGPAREEAQRRLVRGFGPGFPTEIPASRKGP